MSRSHDSARPYGRLVVFLRWPVLLVWFALAVGAVVRLPAPEPDGAGLQALVPEDSAALGATADVLLVSRGILARWSLPSA